MNKFRPRKILKEEYVYTDEDGKLHNFSNCGLWTTIRFALLRILIGKCVVMANVRVAVIKKDKAPIMANHIHGSLMSNCRFAGQPGISLKITQIPRTDSPEVPS